MKKNNKIYFTGQVRIISGRWRGRKLAVLNSPGLRPTTDRIRETLFNWLSPVIQGARCLDCFAGSGALGFEALSRSAASITFLEKNRAISAQLSNNILALEALQAKIITADSLRWLMKSDAVFDIVFLDPPFYQGMITAVVTALEKHSILAEKAWIYIETEIENSILKIPAYWHLHRKKTTNKVVYQLYFRHSVPESKIMLN